MYFFSRMLLRIMLRALGGLKSIGSENIPAEGGVILAPNHISNLDPPAVGSSSRRQVRFMAKEELFSPWIMGLWMNAVGSFPVRRGTADRKAIKRAIDLLNDGHVVCVFPEGTRSPDGELQDPELGIGLIALKSRAPVVPIAVIDTEKALPPGGGPHRHAMKIAYGKPLTFPDLYDGKESRKAMKEVGRRVMEAIAELRKS